MFNAEVLAFILYFIVIVGIGVYFFMKDRETNGEKEFFLGGRSMGPWVTAMSAQASDMSAWLLMGLPGSIMAFGFGQMWIGIGLALAKTIIEKSGGIISVTSSVGKGTTFDIRFFCSVGKDTD